MHQQLHSLCRWWMFWGQCSNPWKLAWCGVYNCNSSAWSFPRSIGAKFHIILGIKLPRLSTPWHRKQTWTRTTCQCWLLQPTSMSPQDTISLARRESSIRENLAMWMLKMATKVRISLFCVQMELTFRHRSPNRDSGPWGQMATQEAATARHSHQDLGSRLSQEIWSLLRLCFGRIEGRALGLYLLVTCWGDVWLPTTVLWYHWMSSGRHSTTTTIYISIWWTSLSQAVDVYYWQFIPTDSAYLCKAANEVTALQGEGHGGAWESTFGCPSFIGFFHV